MLATDEGDPAQPVRGAILDVADGSGNEGRNGAFDEGDLDLFLMHIDAPGLNPLDYGRYDLNGDGSTGSGVLGGSDRVDLDLDGGYGLASVDVEGLPVRFDEEVPSDLQVLCYSAYSSAYAGDEQLRRERLGLTRCVEVELEVLFPATVQPAVNNLLSVRVVDLDLGDPDGTALGQAGVRIELNPSGGTVDQFAGITNADGIFQTNARLFPGQPALVIEVIARVGAGGPVLAQQTVTASTSSVPTGVTRISSRGTVSAVVPSFPNEEACRVAHFRNSPAGVTAWSDSIACSGLNGSGGQEQGSATAAFTERYAGSDLVAVTASASGTASSKATGAGQYELMFSVVRTTTITIDAQLTTSGFSTSLFLFVGGAEPIRSDVAGSIHATQTLSPGSYALLINVVGGGGSASFDLAITFGAAG